MTRTYTPLPNPDDGLTALPTPYRPQRKAYFLSHMIRAAQSGPFAGINIVKGNLWHRVLSLVAELLERQSFVAGALAVWSLREGAYRAWHGPLFPARDPATYARGPLRIVRDRPAPTDQLLPRGTLIGSLDGRTALLEADTVFPAAETSIVAQVVSTLPGTAGHFEAGELRQLMGAAGYRVSNPAPIAGSGDAESDGAIYRRFQDRVEGSATGNRLAVHSAAMNARVLSSAGEVQEKVTDAALIYPWATPALNGENGTGYVVIDNGSGSASAALIEAAQLLVGTDDVPGVQSAMERHLVIAASTLVVPLALRVYCTRNANRAAVEEALRAVWSAYMGARLIEDGRGRGRVGLRELGDLLDKAHPDVLQCVFINHDGDVIPPLAARAVAGILTADIRRGEVIRL